MNQGLQWGGRFSAPPDAALLAFGSSLEEDPVLAPFDHSSSVGEAPTAPESIEAEAEVDGQRRPRAKMPPENLF